MPSGRPDEPGAASRRDRTGHKRRKFVVVSFACVTCVGTTGCELNSGNTVVLPITQTTARALHEQRRFVAVAGRRSRLRTAFSLNPDCTTAGFVDYRLVTLPTHGTAAVEQGLFYPDYPAGSVRAACDQHRQPGVALFYMPAPGYVGPDFLTLLAILPDGIQRTVDYRLDVE